MDATAGADGLMVGNNGSLLEWLAVFPFHGHAHTQTHTHYTHALSVELFMQSSVSAAAGETQARAHSSHVPQLPGNTWALFCGACSLGPLQLRISHFAAPSSPSLPCPRPLGLMEVNRSDPLGPSFSPSGACPA